MKRFETIRRVTHASEDMFNLVADVESYPSFVPLCDALKIRTQTEEDGKITLIADMTVAYKMFRETFKSQVLLDRANNEIIVEYLDGPFSHLFNRWQFVEIDGGGCDVHFLIEYEFRSKALQILAGAVFDKAFRKLAVAFEDRADQIYGHNLIARAQS